jgi:RNA polymerase sigma-70 factor, ECF subfamily
LTSGESLRLCLVAGPSGERAAAAARELPVDRRADARTGPAVTHTLEDHLGTVYRYALRLAGRTDIAEDLTQETMLRAIARWGSLRDVRIARLWLLRITSNVWTDHLRRTKFRPRALADEPACRRSTPATISDAAENVAQAFAVLDELPSRQRQVLYLVTCEQLTQDEVAEVLGMRKSAVKANLSLARKAMRERLRDLYLEVCGRRVCEENRT